MHKDELKNFFNVPSDLSLPKIYFDVETTTETSF